ncbi:MAG: hypothetical protein ACLUSP_09030 [Christensenellales bacterium]
MITMSALLAIIVALGVAESVISSSLYRRLSVTIGEIESIVKENGDDFSDGKAIEKANEAIEEWEKWRSFARMTSNHSTVRGFEDRLYSMRAYVECAHTKIRRLTPRSLANLPTICPSKPMFFCRTYCENRFLSGNLIANFRFLYYNISIFIWIGFSD